MNINTIKIEIRKKIANMNRDSFENFIFELLQMYLRTHPKENPETFYHVLHWYGLVRDSKKVWRKDDEK